MRLSPRPCSRAWKPVPSPPSRRTAAVDREAIGTQGVQAHKEWKPMPCTILTTHRWRTLDRVVLSLPDGDGYFEVHYIWQCRDCGTTRKATGFLQEA
jgi:hypothetical protein